MVFARGTLEINKLFILLRSVWVKRGAVRGWAMGMGNGKRQRQKV